MRRIKNIRLPLKGIAVLLFFFLQVFYSFSDTLTDDKAINITRIEKQLGNSPVGDKVNLLNLLAKEYLSVNPEKSKIYANNALELARILNNREAQSRALYNLGEANYFLYNYDSAIDAYLKSLEIEETKGNDTIISEILNSIGLTYESKGEYKKAQEYLLRSVNIEKKLVRKSKIANRFFYLGNVSHSAGDFQSALIYFKKAFDIEELLGNKQKIADIYNSIGIIYFDLGSYEKALSNYMKSLQLVEELQNKQGIAHVLNNIGIVNYEWGNKEKALEYYQKSLNIEEELGNRKGIAGSYNNIGIVYSNWDQNEIAIDYYNKALEIYEEFRETRGIAQALNNIGESYSDLGNSQKALDYLMESLEIEKKLGNKLGIAQSYNSIGMVYFKVGNFKKAIEFNNKSLQIADSLKLSSVLLVNYELFYKIYLQKKNYAKALEYFRFYTLQKDTIYNKQFHRNLAEIQVKYEIDKIDREREMEKELMIQEYQEKEKEVRTQRTYLVIIFILMVIFGILVYYDIKSKTKANKKLKEINKEITGQKEKLSEALDELSKSETKYKNLIEYSPTGIMYIDKKGNIIEVNKKMLQILGSPGEESTKEINCLEYPPLKKVGLSDDILNCIETGNIMYNEKEYKSKWGKDVFLKYIIAPVKNKRGNITSLIINIEDVTYSKKIEKSRTQSELKYRILVENSLQAMLIIQDEKLIFANSRMKELTQYSFKELSVKEKNWLRLIIHPDDYERALNNIKGGLEGEKIPARTEYKYIRKDGKVRWIETLGSIVDYYGKPALLVVAIDVTERKETESILIESGEKLREANAMKDKFFSIIAHDLKNPFNAIMGFSNLLYEAYDNIDEKQRKIFIKNICEASESTFKLLQNLLEWSRTQTENIDYNPEIIDISVLVNENITVLKSSAINKGIKVNTTVTYNTTAFADENMIKAVIRNLLSNAIKFAKPGGKIEITAENTDNTVEVCVADMGIGIEEKNLNKLFRIDDQFKTIGTANEQGTGLGLILCKEFVERNTGKIWAESELGIGSKFKFTLPRHRIY
ncbi:MAG: tetratricopeptide repeat protein [Bacteroidales bacterium]|nr:tetratricopeptide repeat protein [Bacteroidales bacterium]